MRTALLVLILFTLTDLFAQSNEPASLEITFTGIRKDRGKIAIGINRTEEGWPRKPHLERNWVKQNIVNGTFTVTLNGLEYGTYAVSVLDDENSNLEMDMTIGIPKEGWGFSRNPPFKLSAPGFEECSFEIDEALERITIEINYMGKGK